MKKLLTCLFIVAVAVIFMAAPAAAEWGTSDSNNLTTVKNDVATIKTSNANILTQLQNIYTRLGTVGGYIDTVETKLQTLIDSVSKITGYIDGVESSLTAIQKSIENIDGTDSNIATLFGNGWASTGGTSANNRTTWYGYMLSNLSNIYVRLSGTNTYLEHIETSSDSILKSLNTLSVNFSRSILYGNGDDGGSFGLIDLLSSTGSVKSNVYSVFDTLAYQDVGGNWHSYVQEMWTTLDSIPGVLQTINTNVYNAGKTIHDDLGLIFHRQGDMLTQLGYIEMLSVRIRQLIDGTGSEGTGLLPETIGIHSDTSGIHSDTSDLLSHLVTDTYAVPFSQNLLENTNTITQSSGYYIVNGNSLQWVGDGSAHYISLQNNLVTVLQSPPQQVFILMGNAPGSLPTVWSFDSYLTSLHGTYYFTNVAVVSSRVTNGAAVISRGTKVDQVLRVNIGDQITVPTAYYINVPANTPVGTTFQISAYGPVEVSGVGGLLQFIARDLDAITNVVADSFDQKVKDRNTAVRQEALDDFVTGSDSTTSLGAKGLGNVKSIGDSVGSKLDSGVSAGQLGTALDGALSNDGGLGWFSSDTASDLDTVAAPALEFDPDPIVTDYYNDYQSQVQAWLSLHGGDDG